MNERHQKKYEEGLVKIPSGKYRWVLYQSEIIGNLLESCPSTEERERERHSHKDIILCGGIKYLNAVNRGNEVNLAQVSLFYAPSNSKEITTISTSRQTERAKTRKERRKGKSMSQSEEDMLRVSMKVMCSFFYLI